MLAPDATAGQQACWARIAAHLCAGPGGIDLAAALVRKHRWSPSLAAEAVEEYARFCFLAVAAGHAVSPSAVVDEVWHLHLQHTRDYWGPFCGQVLGMPLHHEPGTPEATHRQRLRDDYAETLATYHRFFGPPPAAAWPSSVETFDRPPRFRLTDMHAAPATRRQPSWPQALAVLAALLLGILLVPAAEALGVNPLDWDGPTFLQAFLGWAAGSVALCWILRRFQRGGGLYQGPPLTPYEFAYLQGGPARAMDAAVSELCARQAVVIEGKTLVAPDRTGPLPPPLDRVLAQIRRTPTVRQLTQSMRTVLAPMPQVLADRGLLVADRAFESRTLWPMAPVAAVWLLGLAKALVGHAREKPIGLLVVLLIVLFIALLVLLGTRPRRSAAADTLLRGAKTQHAHLIRAPRTQDLALAVALGGTAVLSGTAYADWHAFRQTPAGGGGDSGTGSGCSGGGGDGGGGGGCSSGGCGGCGGGGD